MFGPDFLSEIRACSPEHLVFAGEFHSCHQCEHRPEPCYRIAIRLCNQPRGGQSEHQHRAEKFSNGTCSDPKCAPRVVINHPRTEDTEESGKGGRAHQACYPPMPGSHRERDCCYGGKRCEKTECDNFSAEPGSSQTEEGAPCFERLAEMHYASREPEHGTNEPQHGERCLCRERQEGEESKCTSAQLREREHPNERPVSWLKARFGGISRDEVQSQRLLRNIPCCRQRDARFGRAGKPSRRCCGREEPLTDFGLRISDVGHFCESLVMSAATLAEFNLNILVPDHRNADGFIRAGLDAGGSFADREALAAHVALADDAARFRIFRHIVGAFENAVLTADALVIEVAHNAGDRIFLVCQNRAPIEAPRVNTMMTSRRDCLLEGSSPIVAHKLTDIAPGFAVIEAVERVTRCDARFAAAAFIEIHLESELLA